MLVFNGIIYIVLPFCLLKNLKKDLSVQEREYGIISIIHGSVNYR